MEPFVIMLEVYLMKKMKKLLALVLSLAMMAALSACGSSSGTTDQPADNTDGDAASDGVVELEFWHCWSGGNADILNSIVDAFNASHENIHVTASYQGDYWEAASKAYSAVSTGEAPDLLMMGTDHVSIFMKEGGILENLVPYMDASGYNKDDLVPAFTNTYWGEDGGLYALSFGRSVPVLYVNTDMLDQVGASVPTTWDEVDEVSQKLLSAGVCEYGYALPYDSQYFQMIVPQMGGKVWNETGDALGCIEDGTLAKGLQMLQDQVNNKTLYYGPTQDSSSTCRALFLDKKCAMYLHSVSNLAKIDSSADFNYQVAFVPEGERASVNTGGCTVTMLSSSEYKDACWEFLQWFITSDEGAVQICTQIGYLPFTYSMTESDAIKDLWERIPGSKTAFDEADQIGEDSRNANTGDCLNTFMGAMEAVLYDNEDVNTVVANLDEEVKNIIG